MIVLQLQLKLILFSWQSQIQVMVLQELGCNKKNCIEDTNCHKSTGAFSETVIKLTLDRQSQVEVVVSPAGLRAGLGSKGI